MQTPEHVAAVDLGSNSFHMIVSRIVQGEPTILDRIREQVQLAAGLNEEGQLSIEAQDRALACLNRFGQRLSSESKLLVRAVGTNTLRVASNSSDFLSCARRALGHPIEIIPGSEEARLIYLGVAHTQPFGGGRRVVMDIGGGSTECILGEGFEAINAHSLYMGCVTWARRFFEDGERVTKKAMRKAVMAARLELEPIERIFKNAGWQEAFGASGTLKAALSVVQANDWGDVLTSENIGRIERELIDSKSYKDMDLKGLKPERGPVFAGGVAIIRALFESLEIDTMAVSSGALREGLIYDLLGRIRHEDVRERTISAFQERFHVDLEQAQRVEKTAFGLFEQVHEKWDLDEDAKTYLSWGARLHEIGLAISYRQHHRHAGYLLANADMAGFSRDDQLMLAALAASQRRGLETKWFSELDERQESRAAKLRVLMRLAVLLERARDPEQEHKLKLCPKKNLLRIKLKDEDVLGMPLTVADLKEEVERLKDTQIELELVWP